MQRDLAVNPFADQAARRTKIATAFHRRSFRARDHQIAVPRGFEFWVLVLRQRTQNPKTQTQNQARSIATPSRVRKLPCADQELHAFQHVERRLQLPFLDRSKTRNVFLNSSGSVMSGRLRWRRKFVVLLRRHHDFDVRRIPFRGSWRRSVCSNAPS